MTKGDLGFASWVAELQPGKLIEDAWSWPLSFIQWLRGEFYTFSKIATVQRPKNPRKQVTYVAQHIVQ